MEAWLFYIFSIVAVLAGLRTISATNPIASALSLVVCFFCLAADYVLLDAHFVAVIQVLVYAGAIMVLFIFVIMLLNMREDLSASGVLTPRAIAGLAAAGLLGVGLVAGLERVHGAPASLPDGFGSIASVGRLMFGGPYLLPFEVVSVLLTVAVVGAVVLAKREI
ncbi:MAG: NADH-quinone oxidoreductase subunit J [Myxococcota bacterium]